MLISKFCPAAALLLMYLHSLLKVSCQDVSKSPAKQLDDFKHVTFPHVTDVTNGLIRFHKLYHVCTKRHVQIRPIKKKRKKRPKKKCGRFKAVGRSDDNYITLVFESKTIKGKTGFTIRENRTNLYLCFNNKGKPTAMCSGDRLRCLFEEVLEQDFSIFRSIRKSKKWYLGFNKQGKPLPSKKFRRKHLRRCFRFLKRDNGFSSVPDISVSGPLLGNNTDFLHKLAGDTLGGQLWSQTEKKRRLNPS
ncbi:fibroblast growth factor 8-like [Tachypleus tridentatus]|uniref:fibroblast growth factor 8-like n=1 Tax=Tachypleus tridentatus TaxID=6853 RepID=UPI003FD50BD9